MPELHPMTVMRTRLAAVSVLPWPHLWIVAPGLLLAFGWLLPASPLFPGPNGYLPVHTGLEFLSMTVGAMVVALGWNLRDSRPNSQVILLAAVFLYVGLVQFAHTLSYQGMPYLVTPSGPEKAINFWLAGRLGLALGLVGVALLPLVQWSRLRCLAVVGSGLAAALLAWWIGFHHADWLPRTFIPGEGLTPFKIAAEYALAGVFLCAAALLCRRGRREQSGTLGQLGAAAWISALAGLFFTLYVDVTDLFNILGHLYQAVADWLVYRALFVAGEQAPFRALKREEERLEQLVAERTMALEAASAQFRQLTESLPQLVWTCAPDGLADYLGPQWVAYTGVAVERQLGAGWLEQIHPEDRQVTGDAGRAAIRTGFSYDIEFRIRRRDGVYRWFRSRAVPLRDEHGAVVKWFGTCTDIHDLKQAQESRRRSEERLRMALEAAGMNVFEYDAATDEVYREGQINVTFGLPPKSTGMAFLAHLHPEDRARFILVFQGLCPERPGYVFDYRFRLADGSYRWLSDSALGHFDAGGRLVRLLGVCADLSERKRAEMEIQRLNADLERRVEERTAQLQASNKELQSFTYAASHDMKGPLGRINSFSALLERNYRDRLEGDGLMFLDLIRRNATRLTVLIEDLLAHAQIEQRALEVHPVDLQGAIRLCLQEKEEDIREAGARLRLHLPADPVLVRAHPHGLSQVLRNLVGNALKYSAGATPPVIDIGVEVEEGNSRLWIRDNGIGFDMAYHDTIFEIFRRLHTYEEFAGSGVGLAIVKKAVDRMGGRVWAQSEPGRGATFFLELPVAASRPADREAATA